MQHHTWRAPTIALAKMDLEHVDGVALLHTAKGVNRDTVTRIEGIFEDVADRDAQVDSLRVGSALQAREKTCRSV